MELIRIIGQAPAQQKFWLSETLMNSLGYLAIGQVGRELNAEERKLRAAKNEELTHGIDTRNEYINAQNDDDESALFRDMAGFETDTLSPLPESVMNAYKGMFVQLVRVRREIPVQNIEDLLLRLKEPSNKAQVQRLQDAVVAEVRKAEAGLMKTDQLQSGREGAKARMAERQQERWTSLREKVLEAYAAATPQTLSSVFDELPAWAQYKLAMTVLNNATRITGRMGEIAVRLAGTPYGSDRAAEHAVMGDVTRALQEYVHELEDGDESGEIAKAFAANRLDVDRHTLERQAA